jgi:phosphoenolpyruvate-protein kinase (PTS system EI component)
VPSKEYHHIARACDMGAEGIMIPMVSTAAEAKAVVELADTMPLAPMPATREKKVRGFVKETVGNLLINQQLVIDHRFA